VVIYYAEKHSKGEKKNIGKREKQNQIGGKLGFREPGEDRSLMAENFLWQIPGLVRQKKGKTEKGEAGKRGDNPDGPEDKGLIETEERLKRYAINQEDGTCSKERGKSNYVKGG